MTDDEPLIEKRALERLHRVVRAILSGTPYAEASIYQIYSEDDSPRYLRQDEAFERFASDLEAAVRGAAIGNGLMKNALMASALTPSPSLLVPVKSEPKP